MSLSSRPNRSSLHGGFDGNITNALDHRQSAPDLILINCRPNGHSVYLASPLPRHLNFPYHFFVTSAGMLHLAISVITGIDENNCCQP